MEYGSGVAQVRTASCSDPALIWEFGMRISDFNAEPRPIRNPRSEIRNMNDLPRASLYEKALVLLGSRHKYICEGTSMNPTLRDGEVVLVDREATTIEVGDIVVAKHPIEQSSEVVKRVSRINERGHYFLIGDNPDDSTDSRHYGAVTREYIKGKVVARMGS